jgi:glycosyltransferase involved in cell wall biosynthesis
MMFSIIVANYNNNEYLKALIESVIAQTYKNWELIIVDDCSIEDPYQLIKPFQKNHQILYYRHINNLGASATFKKAVDLSSGVLIGMLGADDALTPEALSLMVDAHMEHSDCSLINSACFWCDNQLNIIEKYKHYKAVPEGAELINHLSIGSFAVFKRSAYLKTEGFDPKFRKALDHDIYLKLDEVGKIHFIDKPLYLYRQNINGISQNENGVIAAHYSNLAIHLACERRKNTDKFKHSRKKQIELRKKWILNEAYYTLGKGKRMNAIHQLLKGTCEIPQLVLEKTFYGHLIKSIFSIK